MDRPWFPPVFDGKFKSQPVVSLRGASKQGELSSTLLLRTHQERKDRELHRRQLYASTKIQSAYRGYRTRTKIYNERRKQFDSHITQCTSHSSLLSLTHALLMFYKQKEDSNRLSLICQKWIKFKENMLNESIPLQQLLVLCLYSLRADPYQPLAGSLRMIDVFTNVSDHEIFIKLLNNGYYSVIRHLIEVRLPPPEPIVSNDGAPYASHVLHLANDLLQYISKPLDAVNTQAHPFILKELFAPMLSPHLLYVILPVVSKAHTSLSGLLTTAVIDKTVVPSLTLCYCLLRMVELEIVREKVTNDSCIENLLIVLSKCFHERNHQSNFSQLSEKEVPELVVEADNIADVDEIDQDIFTNSTVLLSNMVHQITSGCLVRNISTSSNYSAQYLQVLSSICFTIIATSDRLPMHQQLFQAMSLNTSLVKELWKLASSMTIERLFGPPVNCLDQLCRGSGVVGSDAVFLMHLLTTFCCLLSICLSSLHDMEFTTQGPFSMPELVIIIMKLRDIFASLFLERNISRQETDKQPPPQQWKILTNVLCRLLKQLHERSTRVKFCPHECWIALTPSRIPPELFLEVENESEVPSVAPIVMKEADLLRKAPFLFSFTDRVMFFHRLVAHVRYQNQYHLQEFGMGPSISVTARRTHLYEDAFSSLATEDLRKILRVNLVNAQGLDEAGIDGGGLSREFLSETLKIAFDPNRGFFATTEGSMLYPNPKIHLVYEDFKLHLYFLGALLAKALYENLLVELPFAPFFLSKLTTPGYGWADIHQLSSLDVDLYRHLLWLKHYQGNFEALQLDFTILVNEYGQSKVLELRPGGKEIRVTSSNKIKYIHLMAHHYLNVQIATQFEYFRKGVNSVIPIQWLTLFNQEELQTLLSGAEIPINLSDLRAHTRYSGEYNEEHQCIMMFWKVLEEFTEKEKQLLLKFVTSCSRPPLLGFGELHPPFTILSAKQTDYLPSASTCMNLLKLPMFTDASVMKDKLKYAISSGAGFELS